MFASIRKALNAKQTDKYKLTCWVKETKYFAYGWDDERKTWIQYNSVSISVSLCGYWFGVHW